MRRAGLVAAGCAALVVLSGCGAELRGPSAPAGQTNDDPNVLRSKLGFLQADECFAGDLAEIFPRCGKYITQLDSTSGTVDKLLAPKSPRAAEAARELRSGVDGYQRARCDAGNAASSADARQRCPEALGAIKRSLVVLGSG